VRHKESAPIIENNECYNNELSGVGLEKGATATLKNNHLYQNGRAGIGLKEASTAFIEGNKIEKNTLSGIGSLDKSTLIVKNNRLLNNTMSGITVMDNSKATIEGNTIQANGTIGIVCSDAQVTIKNNNVLENIHHGIGLYRNARGKVSENIINGNGAHDKRGSGILVVSSDKPLIQHNQFNDNYGPGVYTRRCAPLIEENVFKNDLVFAKFHAAPTIKKNVFYSAGKAGGKKVKSGVDVRETSHPIIIENEFYGKFGIAVRSSSDPLILKNKFSGSHKNSINSGRSGIKVDRTCHPTIVDNIFYNGNKLTITGKSVTKNIIIARGRTGRAISTKAITEAKPEQHGGNTVVIAGNLFIGAKKGKRR
jgi:parallel beta-helix repeat protein